MISKNWISAIYQIRNVINGRIYVGSAINLRKRLIAHRSLLDRGKHHSKVLQRSWHKHGANAFSFEVIEYVTPARLIEREQYWIDFVDATNPKTGFNIAPKAGSSLGRKHPPEVCAKMRAKSSKGKKKPPRSLEHSAAISVAKKGIAVLALRGPRGPNPKISAAKKGVPNPAIIASNQRRKGIKIVSMSEERKQKLRERIFSEETRMKMSIAAKAKWARQHQGGVFL